MGSHFKLVGSETVPMTPDLAVQFRDMPGSMTERDLQSKRLDILKDAVLGGTAIAFCWARAKVIENGETYRVNGHHSSTMLAKLNGEFPNGLMVHIDDYEVPDKATLGLLFRQLDSRSSARTVDDIAGAYQGLEPDLVTVPKPAARKAVEGMAWYQRTKIGGDTPVGDDRFNLFNQPKLHPFIQMVGRILSVKTPEFSTPVIGAMFGAWERNPKEAELFYGDVAKQGGGNDPNHPAVVLDQWLVDARERKENKPKEHEVFYACATAWNAYRNHKTLPKITKYSKQKGTPELE